MLMNELFKVNIFTNVHGVIICSQQRDVKVPSNRNLPVGCNKNHTENQSPFKQCNFIIVIHNMTQKCAWPLPAYIHSQQRLGPLLMSPGGVTSHTWKRATVMRLPQSITDQTPDQSCSMILQAAQSPPQHL